MVVRVIGQRVYLISEMVIGTAGHIDHGKTALVAALTGKNTDRLPEERRRGISIDLGYARIALPRGLAASVVDVPGHERFVRHMVAGATGLDVFLLVVAADDGVMPQTREHLRILDLLGVTRGVCALTKRDLVDDETAELARLDVEELLEERSVPIVETSVSTGLGIERLRGALAAVGGRQRERDASGPPRLWVDRSFSLPGPGTIATGTLWSGTVSPQQMLEVLPSGAAVRVRSVQVHDRDVEKARPGWRVAVALAGVSPAEVRRGTVLCAPGTLTTSYRVDVRLEDLELDDGYSPVTLHHGTGEHSARLVKRGAFAQLRLPSPIAAVRGDRVILRRNGRTLGGGTVVDPQPPRRVDEARIRRHAEGSPDDILGALLDAAPEPVSGAWLRRRGLLSAEQLEAALSRAVDLGGSYVTHARFEAMRAEALGRLDEHAATNPLDPGLPIDNLGPAGRWRDRLVDRLPVERRGSRIYRPGAVARTERYQSTIERLRALIAAGGTRPVALMGQSCLDGAEFHALARELERTGEVVLVDAGHGLSAVAYERARATLEAASDSHGRLSVGAYRQLLGLTRRDANILLAHFARAGVTRQLSGHHVLRRQARRVRRTELEH